MSTIEEQVRKLAPQSYRDALRRPLLDRGFGPLDGNHFRHPSGVEVQMWAEGVRIRYPADWADPDYDLDGVFDLAYGTNFDVIIDLAEALIAKVDADRDAKDKT
jgi:hypothetical protein